MKNQKIALITGVSREEGLGFETAKQLAHLGFEVIITARELQKAQYLADQINVDARQVDVTDDQNVSALANEITKKYGKIDVLINNAGAFFDAGANTLEVNFEYVKEALDTNLIGAWRMIKACVPLLLKAKFGRIVNVSSGAGSFTEEIFGMPHHPSNVPVYSITKLALNGLTVKLARELKNTSIKVNSVCPGFVATYPGTQQYGAIPVVEGVKGIIWAATLPDDGPNGGFFRDGKSLNW